MTLVVIVHVLVCLVLIGVVLLQSGKAGDLASAFGGAGSQTAFGARGAATFLTKATTLCAVIFMITSLALSMFMARPSGKSVMEAVPASEQTQPQAQPAQAPAPSEQPPAAPEKPPQQ